MNIETRMIGPDDAAQLLVEQHGNRKVSKARVIVYANEMREGRWIENGVPIQLAILPSGAIRILDGQHRLHAVIETGTPTRFVVMTRMIREDEVQQFFATYDVGKTRTPTDLVHIAAALGYAGVAEQHIVAGLSALMISDVLIAEGPGAFQQVTQAQRSQLLEERLHDVLWAASIRRHYHGQGRNGVPSGALAAAIGIHRFCPIPAEHFFMDVFRGEALFEGDPGYALNKELTRNEPAPRGTVPIHHWWYCLTVKAWNLHAEGRRATRIRSGIGDLGVKPTIKMMRASYTDIRAAD